MAITRGGVKDTRLDANAKETKKIRGQGATSRGQTLSRPSTGMLEAKAAIFVEHLGGIICNFTPILSYL